MPRAERGRTHHADEVKNRWLTRKAERIGEKLGLRTYEVFRKINDPRIVVTSESGWFTQTFYTGEDICTGILQWDICAQHTPWDVLKEMDKKNISMMQMRLPRELHRWFKKFAQSREVTMSEIIIEYMNRLRNKHSDVKIPQMEEL